MKKITFFTRAVLMKKTTPDFYKTKTEGTVSRFLFTLCLTAVFLLGATGQMKAAPVAASLTFNGGTNKTASNTIDGISFTTYQYFSGGGSTSSNYASFTVTGPCTIYFYATGGDNAATSRSYVIHDGTTANATPFSGMVKTAGKSYAYTGGAATFKIYPSGGGGSIYGVYLDYGVSGTPEINIQGNATNIVDGDTAYSVTNRTDFGSTNAGTGITGVTYTYTVQNTGTGTLTLGAITLGDTTNYSSTAPVSTTVASGGTTTFTITFNPTTAGVKNSTFSIVTDDSDENPYNFAITGTGVAAPEIDIKGNSIIITDGDSTPSSTDWTDFGSTATGVGVTRTYTVTNTGTATLTLGTITLGDTTNYSSTAPLSTSLAAGASTTFTITFNPTTTGVKNTTVSIVTNDGDENPYDYSITGTGTGVLPEIDIRGNTVSIVSADSSPSTTDWTDLGSGAVGAGITKTFTIHNTGAATLTIGAISFSGGNAASFSATSPGTTIAAGASATFDVTLTPASAGTKTTTISIVNDDSDENPYTFALQGTGTASPEINIQGNATNIVDGDTTYSVTNRTDFGSTNAGTGITGVTYTYTVQNTGSSALTLGTVTLGDTTNYSYTAPASTSVAAGGSTTFTITFNPTTTGVKNSTFSIVTNDSDENPYNFAITGTGVAAPEINIKGNSVIITDGDSTPSTTDWTDFGSTTTGVGVTKTYTITNTGTATLTLGTITLGDTTNYSMTALGSTSLAAGASTTFTVTFNPTTTGAKNTTISMVTNDGDENPYNFSITGTGTAVVATPEINLRGNTISIADGDTTPSTTDDTDFGPTNKNVGATKTFTIENTGGSTLTIGTITFSGGNPSDFSVTTPPSATVAPGASTTFVVTLTSTGNGTKTTTMSIVNNDSDENPYDFKIQGTCGTQEIKIRGGSGPSDISDGDTNPTTGKGTDFGSTGVSSGTVTSTFIIQNTFSTSGASFITLGAITIAGTNASDFTVTTAPATTITGNSSTTMVVTFNPSGTGLRTATISIVNNDSDENPYNFSLQGTGTEQEIDIQSNSTSIADGDSTPSLTDNTDFGPAITGTPITKTYTIYNTGTDNLTVGAITIPDATNFSYTNPVSTTIASGGNTTFTITFTPASTGVKNTTFSIVTNDSDENPYNFSITGTGSIPPEINIQANSTNIVDGATGTSTGNRTDFGSSNTGTPVTYTYTILNAAGNGPLTLGAITLGDNTNYSATTPVSTIVAAGSSTTFTITFNPTTAGVKNTTFSIVTNDTDENPYNFALTGTGVTAPEIDVRGNSVSIVNGDLSPSPSDYTDFGSVDFSSGTVTKTFYIHNTGTSNLTIGTITKGGTNPTEFTITTSPSATIAAGASSTLVISFDPSILGTRSAEISIVNGDADENPYVFAITGNGTQTFYDSDGDGIFDNVDDDDDNDGILDATEETNCTNANGTKTNYNFLKEDFGTGTRTSISGTNYCYEDGIVGTNTTTCTAQSTYSLDDGEYTVGPNARVATWSDGTTNTKWYQGGDHTTGTGRMALFNAATTAGTFYTATITGTLPGIPITYSFWGLNLDRADDPGISGRTRPNIKVEFRDLNDVLLSTLSTGDIPPSAATTSASDWHQYGTTITLPTTLTGNSFKVIFINNAAGGSGNDLAIDDISITQSLCDYENDGVADVYDLDSDNDGIPDIVEAGLGSLSNGKGKITATWLDTNTNGIHDSAEIIAALSTLNSDGDTLPDYLDLDSDNDSVFDVNESGAGNTNAVTGYLNGDGDINDDGLGNGTDTEAFRSKDTDGTGAVVLIGDGILDLFDYGTGVTFSTQYGNSGQADPIDTDGDGTPDYLDTMSDGSTQDITQNKLLYGTAIDSDGDGIVGVSGVNTDADKDGILDAFDTNTATKGSPRNLNKSLYLDFDGRNDYAQDATTVLTGSAGSIMAWIDLNSAFSGAGFIVGQDSFNLNITSGRILQVTCKGTTISAPTALDTQRWYHVAATYTGNNLNLYINGTNVSSSTTPTGSIVDATNLTIGRNPSTSTNFFKGKIDEVRVFNVRLTDNQVQRMVYQEIDEDNTNLRGKYITGKEIDQDLTTSTGTLTFSNILRYYRMDTYKDDIIDNLTTATVDVTGMKMYNHKYINLQQAPMPFVTTMDGDLTTAVTNSAKDIQGTDINNYNTIVNIKHNNTTTSNRTDLGLVVDSGKSLTVNNDTGLTNTWWLSLHGKIDLVGMSQLIQNSTSDLDIASAGYIERDQQGQTNKFNYNYWSSPVNPINTTANNTNYTVAGVMKDGTTSTPQSITWIGGYDGSPTSPISLARYWLYKFESATDAYANWVQFTETSALRVGQGYTLKGSGAATATQNLTFVGKPNNGTISNTVGSGQLLLVGNPYPSAIDAYKFLDDNLSTVERSTIDGTLYFWQHAPENNSHFLANYLGSYGVLNRAGGVPPVVPTLINGGGTTAKIPNQYIPVGQGFFVYGTAAGGSVQFNNSQRAFVKENNAASNSLFKTKASNKTAKSDNNDNATISTNKKIRLGYDTANGYHRQVLLAFMEDKATKGMDYGYDGETLDDFPNDMSLLNGETPLVIEGEGYFDVNAIYPISVKSDIDGKVSFSIDEIENFDNQQAIFIHDNLTDTYHNIRDDKFEIDLPSTSSTSLNSRFSLRFTNKTLGVDKNDITNENAIIISHTQKGNILEINNKLADTTTIEKVTLYNIPGQSINSWKIENPEEKNIQIPLKSISSGIYIVKIKTSKGDLSKKVIIK